MNTQQLKDMILSQPKDSPVRLAYACGDAECADAINAPGDYPVVRSMTVGQFANWMTLRDGILAKVYGALASDSLAIRSIALLITGKISSEPHALVDPKDPAIIGMLDAFTQAGIVTTADVAAFTESCTGTGSLAEFQFGAGVVITPSQIGATR